MSGAVTSARCLVTILTDGQGKNGSTVAVSVVMATDKAIIVLLGDQHIVTTVSSGCYPVRYNNLFLLVTIQPHPHITICDGVCSTDGETEYRLSGGCVFITRSLT